MLVALSKRKLEKPKTIDSSKNVRWFPWIYVCDLDGSGKDEIYSFRQEKGFDGKKLVTQHFTIHMWNNGR